MCEVLTVAQSQLLVVRGTPTIPFSGMIHPPYVERELLQDRSYWNTEYLTKWLKVLFERKALLGKEWVL